MHSASKIVRTMIINRLTRGRPLAATLVL
jgi:hypothetical protein